MIEWRILTEEEEARYAAESERQAVVDAENARLVEACRLASGHEWVLDLPEPSEDDDGVDLHCLRCPAGVNDVYPDGHDMIYLDHGDVEIRAGCHNSAEPLTIPVTVDVASSKMWTDYGWEYDAELIVEYREATT